MEKKKHEETKQEKVEGQVIDAAEAIIPAEMKEAAKEAEIKVEVAEKDEAFEGAWVPRTELGKQVLQGKIPSIDYLFEEGIKITEPGIVDMLVPGLSNEVILIGGSTGKGGGKRRTPSKRTSRMHKSGRRYRISVMAIIGNSNGYVGFGTAHGPPGRHREVVEKALAKAKLNLIPVRRGCGSWQCKCGTPHTTPFEVEGKIGSVHITLMPAPKGTGLVVMDEVKKVMRLAGIKDIWAKSRGQTSSRENLIKAVFDAFNKINKFRTQPEYEHAVGMKTGRV